MDRGVEMARVGGEESFGGDKKCLLILAFVSRGFMKGEFKLLVFSFL